MRNESLVVSASVVLIVLSVTSIFFGAIQPLARAQNFIFATQTRATTVGELEENFRMALDYPSYIGDEEMAKFLGGNIRSYVASKDVPENISRELLNFMEPYFEKNNVRHLMMAGHMYLNMWAAYKGQSDYDMAVKYYVQSREITPKVYPVLFGLLAIYNAGGMVDEAKEVGAAILALWPTDQGTIDILSKYAN